MALTQLTRIQEIVHKAETTDLTTPIAVVDTHMVNSSLILRVVLLLLNSLLHLAAVETTLMPPMEVTTTTWQCGMQPWLNNNSNNKVQVSNPGRLVLDDDRRALTRDA